MALVGRGLVPFPRQALPASAAPSRSGRLQLAIVAAIVLQLTLPGQLRLGPTGLIPGLEALVAIGLFFATPRKLEGRTRCAGGWRSG